MADTVRVTLKWSYGWGRPRKLYGPGEVNIPVGLARALSYDVEALLSEQAPETAVSDTVDFPPNSEPWMLDPYDPADPTYSTPLPLTAIKGIGPELARVMEERGLATVEDVLVATVDELTAVPGIGQIMAGKIHTEAEKLIHGGSE